MVGWPILCGGAFQLYGKKIICKLTERSEVSFIAFRRKAKRHKCSMCVFPQEPVGKTGRRPDLPASVYIYI